MAVDTASSGRGSVGHRPGVWKQQNKAHKTGRHRSKGVIDVANKGRVSVKSVSKKAKRELRNIDRRNKARQVRARKRKENLARKRSLGSDGTPPFLVAIVPLCATEDPLAALHVLKSCDEDTALVTSSNNGICHHIALPRFKQRFCFFVPPPGDMHAVLDAAKVADTLLMLYSLEDGIDDTGASLLTALFAHGVPATAHAIQGISNVPTKKRTERLRSIQKILEKRFPKEKIHTLDTSADAVQMLRHIGNQKQHTVTYKNKRTHMLAESLEFEPNSDQDFEGTLKVSAYVRGRPIDVNGLVHVSGWGDFQMKQIDGLPDPHPLFPAVKERKRDAAVAVATDIMDVVGEDDDNSRTKVLAKADPAKQVSLEAEAEVDPMDGEQTWPTDEEMREAEERSAAAKRIVKRVPKGTSEYQAAWILNEEVDDTDESDSDVDDADDKDEMAVEVRDSQDEQESEPEPDEGDYETITVTETGDDAKYDERFDEVEDNETMKKIKDARMDAMFPDEVDTPIEIAAQVRFQRYRGLKSFRTSPWDPKENLPADYARIVQFENFERTRKRLMNDDGDGEANVEVGWYVTIHILNVPRHFYSSLDNRSSPLVIYGLLPHEHKMSVVNMAIKRLSSSSTVDNADASAGTDVADDEPIKSKDRLVFHVGYRRFCACPIFSQHTNGNKHKYERFLTSDATVATVYAPVVFPPTPVLVFRENRNGDQRLVACGSVLSVDPNRLIVKRVVLSGHPFKINRRSAVIRYMFFNRGDIDWFKPVELRTKSGRRGHIREPLGTHGHMKCVFDAQLQSQDTVLMNLYKRVYPKWNYDAHVPAPLPAYPAVSDAPMTD